MGEIVPYVLSLPIKVYICGETDEGDILDISENIKTLFDGMKSNLKNQQTIILEIGHLPPSPGILLTSIHIVSL